MKTHDDSTECDIRLILGGVRSGKSRFAEKLAASIGGDSVLYIATAEACDEEMRQRIAKHQRDRNSSWRTLEQPVRVGQAIAAENPPSAARVILLDCMTILVSNLVLRNESLLESDEGVGAIQETVDSEIESLLASCCRTEKTLLIVSGEVGMGLVPESKLGRVFRDLLGWANQQIAVRASETYWMVAGLPVNVARLANSPVAAS